MGSPDKGAFLLGHRLDLEYVATKTLRTNPRNARTHDVWQIKQIMSSIETFGLPIPY